MSDWEHVDKEEIIISEDGLDEAIHNAYLKGRNDVLDKIRTEIDANRETLKIMADDDWYAGKIRGYDCAIEIIDKYKAGSEGSNAGSN